MQVMEKMIRLQKQVKQYRAARRSRTRHTAPPPSLTDYWKARYPKYQLATHIQLMIAALAELKPGDALIITMPPRHSKTETVKAWVEWQLGQHPDSEVMYTSYSVRLARTSSRSIRNEIATGLAFPRFFPNVTLSADSQAATDWGTTLGGFFRAAGVGGSITGMGARFAVIDDPLKDRKAAESEVVREGVWEWFTSGLLTRLSPDASLVLMHTRWHPDDLAGKVLAMLEEGEGDELGGLSWKHLNLAAIYDDPNVVDPMGRELGEALWPARFTLKRLLGMKAANEYDFEALYQQRPRKRGGQVFSDKPTRYEVPFRDNTRIVITADTASSQRKTADFSALVVLAGVGRGTEARADVLEVRHGRFDLAQFGAVCQELQAHYGSEIILEETSQSLPIIQYLRLLKVRVRGVKPIGDKFTRAQPAAAAWNRGAIRLPHQAPWLAELLSETASFTGTNADNHDDQVDALSYGWAEIAAAVRRPGGVSVPGANWPAAETRPQRR